MVLITGTGHACSAGGDLNHIDCNAANPHLSDHEARMAKRIIFMMCGIIFAAEGA